jgi:hypothetical protein
MGKAAGEKPFTMPAGRSNKFLTIRLSSTTHGLKRALPQRQPAFGRHPAVNRELFGTGLLIRQHGKNMRQKIGSRKRGRAMANTYQRGMKNLEGRNKQFAGWLWLVSDD